MRNDIFYLFKTNLPFLNHQPLDLNKITYNLRYFKKIKYFL